MQKYISMAICYDFDGTLAKGNMQEYEFMQNIGYKKPKVFWEKVNLLAKNMQADETLAYMFMMIKESQDKGIPFTYQYFKNYGKTIPLFPGVEKWFDRINQYALSKGILLKHYIISSGLKEMIEGTCISKYFDKIYASSFMYNQKQEAFWPALALNYTNKMQFIFRINKGCLDINDNVKINQFIPLNERAIPFPLMVYLGDGTTDIPCMRTLKASGGYAIAIYQHKEKVLPLIQENRVDIALPADYRAGKGVDIYIKSIIDKVSVDFKLKKFEKDTFLKHFA